MKKKRVLVTGATGFIGRQSLVPLLERGYDVHAVYTDFPLDEKRVQWHKADLLDPRSVASLCEDVHASLLLHFAWYVNPADYKTSPENKKWVEATMDVVRSFHENGGKRATLAGTCMEYDWTIPQDFLSETKSPLKPATLYGLCKNETRKRVEVYAKENRMSFSWGRVFLLYGPYEAPVRLIPYVINSLLRNEPAECSSGEQVRDIMHVRDVADAFASLLDSGVEGVVNIGSGVPIALRDVVHTIADMIGRRNLVHLGAKISNEPPRLVFDTSRLNNEVGWIPCIQLHEGLLQTIEWWRSRAYDQRSS